jgi:hypothetical protein
MRSQRGDLRVSNPDWNEYQLLGAIWWLGAMLAASCGARPVVGLVCARHVDGCLLSSVASSISSCGLLNLGQNRTA